MWSPPRTNLSMQDQGKSDDGDGDGGSRGDSGSDMA